MATKNAIDSANPIEVAKGGTGAATLTDHGVLVGSGVGAVSVTAVGTTGQILTGSTGADPVWTTATYPSTIAKGDILIASAANTITALNPDTAGYVLTDNGAGNAPSWQANPQGTVTSVTAGTNLSDSGTATDPVIDLNASISGMTNVIFANGGAIQTDTTTAHTSVIQAYDVDGTAYKTFITLTNGDTPTCDLDTDVTINSSYIYRAGGTDIPVSDGGTGASSLTDGGILLGSGTGAVTATSQPTDGQLLIGNSGSDPSLATLTAGAGMSITNAAGSVTIDNTLTTNTQTDSYQLVAGDAGKMIIMNKATANTLTIPKDATVDHATGTQILVMQYGAGATTIAAEDGTITIRYDSALTLVLNGQYAVAACVKIDDNEWCCGGNLEAA